MLLLLGRFLPVDNRDFRSCCLEHLFDVFSGEFATAGAESGDDLTSFLALPVGDFAILGKVCGEESCEGVGGFAGVEAGDGDLEDGDVHAGFPSGYGEFVGAGAKHLGRVPGSDVGVDGNKTGGGDFAPFLGEIHIHIAW